MCEALLSIASIGGLLVFSQLSPGPDVFFVFRTALAQGKRAGYSVGAGITLGFFLQTLVVCSAGAWVMQQEWSRWILIAAACWLLYLAWKILPRKKSATTMQLDATRGHREPLLSLLWQGFLCNILNPKCTLFICGLTLGPLQFYGSTYPWYTPALVAGLQMASLGGWVLWSTLLQWGPIRSTYLRHTRGIDTLFAIMLAIFALLLLIPSGGN